MSPELISSRIANLVAGLAPKAKQPNSSTVLNAWIAQAESKLGPGARGGRLGWLVASSVAIATVQRAVDAEGRQLFLLKGGTWLQHRLKATARTTKDVNAPAWMTAELSAIAVPDELRRPHAVVKAIRDNHDQLRLSRPARARALRILDAIAKTAESRGYEVRTPDLERGYGRSKGYLSISIRGHSHVVDMSELIDKVPHEPTMKELKDKERHSWVRIPAYDHVPSGRLTLKVVGGGQVRQETFADTKTIDLEDRLPTVLQELELRSAAEEERERKLELERQERRRHWEQVHEEAKSGAREQHRADTLMSQAQRWQQANDLAAYLDAVAIHVETLHGENRGTDLAMGQGDIALPVRTPGRGCPCG
jgi:hypothetical protein